MMSSGQIAMMMSQQNQGFAGNMAFSQQISQGMPGAYGGGQGQGFSYGGGTSNRAIGSAVGDRAMAAGAGAASFGMGLAGSAAMGGAFMGAAGAAWSGGAGFLGAGAAGMVAAAPIAGALAIGKHAIGSMMAGAREQSGVENALGGFQMANTGSSGSTGGFDRGQSKMVGDMMRKMSSLPEMMTSMGELTKIMDKMGQAGMMQGTQNVAEFEKKFKDNINVLKQMSKVMGSTMEEALPMFGELRRTGFYSAGDILKNSMSRQITGGVTGMNQGQVASLASAGSQMSFQTGGSRKTGAEHSLRVANQLGMAKQMGILSGDQIMELTGQEGAAGVQAMSEQLTQASYRMMRGAPGTMMTLAMGAQEKGKYTGEMDKDLVGRFQAGEFSTSDLMKMARKKSSGRGAAMSYVARKQEMKSEMAGSLGVAGQSQMLQNILGERGFNNPDAQRIVAKRFGLSERESDLMVQMGQKMPDISTALRQQTKSQARKIAQESSMRENYSWDATKAKIGKRVSNAVTEPFKKIGADIRNSINDAVESFVDDVTGEYTAEVTKGMSELVRGSMAGVSSDQSRLRGMIMGSSGLRKNLGKGRDFTPGAIGASMNWLSGSRTSGENLASEMRQSSVGRQALTGFQETSDMSLGQARSSGYHVLERDRNMFSRDDYTLVSQQGVDSYRAHMTNLALGGKGQTEGLGKSSKLLEAQWARGKSRGGGIDILGMGGDYGSGNQAMQALEREFEAVKMGHDFSGLEGQKKVSAIAKKMSQQGAAYENFKLASGAGDAEALGMMGMHFGGGQLGLKEIFAERADSASFTTGGMRELAETVKKSGKRVDKILGDKAASFKAAMSEKMGSGAGEVYGAYLDSSSVLGLTKQEVSQDQAQARNKGGFGRKHGEEELKNKKMMDAVAKEKYFKFSDYSKAEMSSFLDQAAADTAAGRTMSKSATALATANGGAFLARVQQATLEKALENKKEGKPLSKDQKDALKAVTGKDNPSLEDIKQVEETTALLKSTTDPEDKASLQEWLFAKQDTSIGLIAERFRDVGMRQKTSLDDMRGGAAFKGASEKVQGILGKLSDRAGRMQGLTSRAGLADAMSGPNTLGQDLGANLAALTKEDLTEAQIKELTAGLGDEGEALTTAIGLRKKLGRKGGATLADAGITEDRVGAKTYELLKGLVQTDSKGRITGGQDELVAAVSGMRGTDLPTAAGAEEGSSMANPADIAKNMNEFGANVATLASIVAAMQKTEKE